MKPEKMEARSSEDCIKLRCPVCKTPAGLLEELPDEGSRCHLCGFRFEQVDGILGALSPDRRKMYERFLEEYLRIREAEGRGSGDPSCYLALPYRDLTGRNSSQWRIRGVTYKYFERRVLSQFESRRTLKVLDLGAGTGWLSYRLAQRKHRPVAIDVLADPRDGLGAARHYESALEKLFPRVIAEFDNLPFVDCQFDLAIFNSSLHYSTDYLKTLAEVKRCLKAKGSLIVLDSPIYKHPEFGERMREERHEYFKAQYGFRSDSIPSIEFLDRIQLKELGRQLGLCWKEYRPWYGWKWHLRPWIARIKRARPPSRFHILVGRWSE